MILLAFVPFKVYNKSNFRGRLIHRNINKWDFLPPKIGVDLYTSSTYTPENTVPDNFSLSNVRVFNKVEYQLSIFEKERFWVSRPPKTR